jgi:GMP synthase-like glutamine amidotransferase
VRIAILDFTGHPLPLLDGLPRAGELIIDWLSPSLPEASYSWYDVEQNGQALPKVGDFDGLLISGSEHGVYDTTLWNRPLRRLLIETKNLGSPIFGICFGHQIMADTFGGRAEKTEVGVVIGAREFNYDTKSVEAHVWHKDQVTIVPPEARITASADYCQVGALEYKFPAASVQFHPEYTEYQLCEIFHRGRDHFLTGEQADCAVDSLREANVRRDLISKETAEFYRKYLN